MGYEPAIQTARPGSWSVSLDERKYILDETVSQGKLTWLEEHGLKDGCYQKNCTQFATWGTESRGGGTDRTPTKEGHLKVPPTCCFRLLDNNINGSFNVVTTNMV